LQAETAIYEAFFIEDRELTDREVREDVEEVIRYLEKDSFPPEARQDEPDGEGSSFLVWNLGARLRRQWGGERAFRWEDMIGVLRTIVGDILHRTSGAPDSQAYLEYIEGFLAEAGVSVQVVSREEAERLDAIPAEQFPGRLR
jgi:hypothetical protein